MHCLFIFYLFEMPYRNKLVDAMFEMLLMLKINCKRIIRFYFRNQHMKRDLAALVSVYYYLYARILLIGN